MSGDRLDACIPYGEECELVVVRGWFPTGRVRLWVIERLQRELGVTLEWAEAVEELGVEHRGFARFWNPDDSACPFGGDGGVRLSNQWRWGYVPATWLYEH